MLGLLVTFQTFCSLSIATDVSWAPNPSPQISFESFCGGGGGNHPLFFLSPCSLQKDSNISPVMESDFALSPCQFLATTFFKK